MKLIALTTILILLLSGTVIAEELTATAEVINGNTLISCVPDNGGNIDRAYISIFETKEGSDSARNKMEISVDNKATYLLPGVHSKIEGRCKLFMAKKANLAEMPSSKEGNGRSTIQGEFSLEVN